MSEKAVHAGHRARLRERFLKEGLSGFSEHEVLELLLMFAIPQTRWRMRLLGGSVRSVPCWRSRPLN